MTTLSRTPPPITIALAPDAPARISFRQPVTEAGFVDAGWWPRSHDLTAELPPLLDVLWTAGRDVTRVSYNLTFWEPAPRRMQVDGRLVHLGGFHGQDPLLLTVVDASDQEHIDVLVVPPEADADFAARTLALAGGAGSLERPDRILDLAAAQAGEPASSVRA